MNLSLVVIRSEHIDKLAKFYEQLGLKFAYHRHGKGPFHYSTEIGQTVFEIYPLLKNQDKPDHSIRLGFEIERLDEVISKLRLANVEIVREPQESEFGYYAVIKDLEGRKIELKKAYEKQTKK